MGERPPVAETIDWFEDQSYAGSIVDHRVVEGQGATTADLSIDSPVAIALNQVGIPELYQHQTEAIEAVRDDDNVVVATPTASGKTLTYVVPALERAVDHSGKTLYIAPTQALINDQEDTFEEFASELGFGETVRIGVQTGETSTPDRRHIKQTQPDVLMMTLDQIHYSLLPYAHSTSNWRWLFQQLETVVIDEVHRYRGVFGSHAALIFRRLNRLCESYDASPQYICASATIGNPVEHSARVTGRPESSFSLVDDDQSASGDRHWTLWNPALKKSAATDGGQNATTDSPTSDSTGVDDAPDSPTVPETGGGERRSHHSLSVELFADLVTKGYQTLVFTKAKQGCEQYVSWADQKLRSRNRHDLADAVHAYHASLNDDRRRELEADLRNGEVRGVWSTNALELGIDIGTLDVVILDGYPGTTMNTFQRAGRAGRGEDGCLVVLVASSDPLDQYALQEPDELFEGGAEDAALNPNNKAILPDHVVCAADEQYLTPDDETHFGEELSDVVRAAEEQGRLRRAETTQVKWAPNEDNPQWDTGIRSIDDREIKLIDRGRDKQLATLDYAAALRDAHPDAIYNHRKQAYKVVDLDLETDRAELESLDSNEYTRPLRDKEVTINQTERSRTLSLGGAELDAHLSEMTVLDRVTGYMHYSHPSDDAPSQKSLDEQLPPHRIETMGMHFTIPPGIEQAMLAQTDDQDQYLSALHAIEHALISLYPTAILCDRGDIGGLSTVSHAQTPTGTVFVHDAHPGGAGLTRQAFESLNGLLYETLELIRGCNCESGCPSCIHSPQCGNANKLLDKSLAIDLLERLLEQ
jgi:DEAD/DEAH box helicase domain-containing protein